MIYFSVIHAAKGELVSRIFQYYACADRITKQSYLDEKINNIIMMIGESIGSFHAYHALKNPMLKDACIQSALEKNSPSIKDNPKEIFVFNTIVHGDLHPGNQG